ncbi:hypothetical protein GCM10017556_42620 [Micromonospora sagamiensis]|nr:hypothetical protein GCM10017556_42620 [Micromonospora sagamiensis]
MTRRERRSAPVNQVSRRRATSPPRTASVGSAGILPFYQTGSPVGRTGRAAGSGRFVDGPDPVGLRWYGSRQAGTETPTPPRVCPP